jgi:hypothetical protein
MSPNLPKHMADTRFQHEVEEWVRQNFLSPHFRQPFEKKRLALRSGGTFEFDGVSTDRQIAVCISTGAGVTAGGKYPTAKVQKLRSDMYFLLLADCQRRVLCVTAADMFEVIQKELRNGRVASEIEVLHAILPADVEEKLKVARRLASMESKPRPDLP